MPDAIYVDPVAATSDVILVGGVCYRRDADSDHDVDTYAEDIVAGFDDCSTCEASPAACTCGAKP